MTLAESTILRSLAEADVVTFIPEGQTAAALARFEATLDSLREMQKAGWVELEVAEDKKQEYVLDAQGSGPGGDCNGLLWRSGL